MQGYTDLQPAPQICVWHPVRHRLSRMKTLLLILLFALPVYCQQELPPEFGDISEIAHMTKVYVYSDDLKSRQRLVDKLKKEFQVVGDIKDAEFAVYYTWSGLTTRNILGTRTHAYKGDLMVYTYGKTDGANRIVWSTQASRKTTLSKNPVDKTVERFIKDFNTARASTKPK